MRKLLTFVASLFITGSLLAGGLVTNNNQSAMFTRLQNRNASTDIDAVYFNPAGLTKLGTGFFISLNNQSIFQTQKVLSNYQYFNGTPKEYVGDVKAPLFPGVYVVYNTGKLSFSAGLNPIGGGGGAVYKTGLPSFESMVANIPPSLTSQGITTSQYSADIYFKGSSVYLGYQANIGYKISDQFSVAAGIRIVTASNKYAGHIRSIKINPTYPAFGTAYTGGMVLASDFFTAGATTLNTLAAGATAFVSGLQPIITGGGGTIPLSNGTAAGLTATQIGQIQQILGATGMTPAQIGAVTIAQAQGILSVAAPTFTGKATIMSQNAAASKDTEVDAKETGTGITPIISANWAPSDKLDISVKYEFKTKIDLKTKVAPNMGANIFVDGQIVIGDMPAELSLGAVYRPTSKLMLTASFNEYFDKNVDYDGSSLISINEIDKNFLEYGLGMEYALTDKMRVSAGWSHTTTGVNANYQSDQSFSTNTNSFGGGIGYRIAPKIDLNLGYQRAFYAEGSKNFEPQLPAITETNYMEKYNKSTWMVALGLDFYFGKK
jgi:long-subunit fatty acid transport protein